MNMRTAAILIGIAAAALPLAGVDAPPARPKAGKVEIFHLSDIKPGLKATAWTVLQGTEAEPIPVEIVGRWKNQWGPNQDIIIGKMGGKAVRTNVAGGMSGSPVYIDGKLVGAIALRLSVFSPDAICGITPIEEMLEINDLDQSRPLDAKAPAKLVAEASQDAPNGLLGQLVAAGVSPGLLQQNPMMVPIEAPVTFSGFHESTLREYGPFLQQQGITAVQSGGAGSGIHTNKPAAGWEHSLSPGEAVAGVLVDGDKSVTGLGTVTYNDGKRVLAFGHPFFNLGPIDMPMSKGEVLMTLASQYQPNKMANATEIVGALHQDRHSGIMGMLGAESKMIPVSVKVRALKDDASVLREKNFHFNVFVQQKWTPNLMMLTLADSLSELNEFADEATYRLSGQVEMNGQTNLSLSTMQTSGELPVPAPMMLASWWGDKFSKLYLNNVKTPDVKRVSVTVDLLPERRIAAIENAWVGSPDLRPGDEVPVKVFLRPYRGETIQREFKIRIPEGIERGDHRILLSDADTVNRVQNLAGAANRFLDLRDTVSLINQERSNNKLYVSLLQASPTAYLDDKTLPSLPSSVLNVMQAGRAANRSIVTSAETATEQMTLPFDYVVTGSYSLRIHVN
ncbi:MAG: hypothetical protein C5B51_20330 [Terriglobia bacterium]|nr:MAG: hypothetical protein C5B51_20330 [Terriglobia bacterium]